MKLAGQPDGHAHRLVVVFKEEPVGGKDTRDDVAGLPFRGPAQVSTDAGDGLVDDELQNVVRMLAIAQKARNDPDLYVIDELTSVMACSSAPTSTGP